MAELHHTDSEAATFDLRPKKGMPLTPTEKEQTNDFETELQLTP
jgi:hypothetical protein